MNESTGDPRIEYLRRLDARTRSAAALGRRHGLLANARFAVFLAGLVMAAAAVATDSFHAAWIVLPAALFAVLIGVHERTLRRKANADAGVHFYERALGRIDGRWAGTGVRGEELMPKDHLYAEDLDLFGPASLFELLCTARTRAGEETLAAWLCAPATAEEIADRQEAVEELRRRIDLREELALLGDAVRAGIQPGRLSSWAQAPPVFRSRALRIGAGALAFLAAAALLGWAFFPVGPGPLVLVVVPELLLLRWLKASIQKVLSAIDEPVRELRVLALLLGRLEAEPFESKKLRALKAALTGGQTPASARIDRLYRLLTWAEQQGNMLFAPLAFLLLWPLHFAFALEKWRAANAKEVPRWLDAAGQFEALCALSAYAYEHPADPFPEIVDTGPLYDGEALGHPLIPENTCVGNDVRLGQGPRVYIVSGSNMSGKSTLLRTVGVNAVLAFAGAPVRAKSLRLSPLALGATLRIHDSIQTGVSRFYSEIKRLRQLLEVTDGPLPLLFLMDELLHGTNSHDRRVGAAAILNGFVERGALGLVTTHDLALTETAAPSGAPAENVHFEDRLEGDRLVFDYRLRPGVVRNSNALALMKAVGLPV